MEESTAVGPGMLDQVGRAREADAEGHTTSVWLGFSPVLAAHREQVDEKPTAHPDPFVTAESYWVLWQGERPFTVDFRRRSPVIGKPQLSAVYDDTHQVWVAAAQVKPGAAAARPYKYDLAMLSEDDRIVIVDPMGVVERDPPS
jgi:hypothetical protein